MAAYDDIMLRAANDAEADLARRLEADILYFNSEIRTDMVLRFQRLIEGLARREAKKRTIAIVLTTPGGVAEVAEKLVEVVRNHYELVNFVVPVAAMSAGTIFCMSGDKIFMDYAASLGPIDPQVPDQEGRYLIPALGYLDKVNDVIEKSRNGTITPVEFHWFLAQDLAKLRVYEQARDLSIALLEKWLVLYKFKDWTTHRTTNPGSLVTHKEKQARAREIAQWLSDNGHWYSHGRMIGIETLRGAKLDIDDFGNDPDLQKCIRAYDGVLSDYAARLQNKNFLYNRHIIPNEGIR